MTTKYETVIGLEVHAELKTESKLFCSCSTRFGALPNTQCCPICMGYPGAMPSLNRRAVELAVRAGVAFDCEISRRTRMDRKQYFYPDLPKAYQISQDTVPLCKNGRLRFTAGGENCTARIERIHLEEDAGKLLHEGDETLVDCNRCGVPLIEIVSAPDLRSAEQASAYLRALRCVLMACEISDCKMQEGSLRCDVNISVRKKGSCEMGVRTEIKNLNSFSFVEKAIRFETERQIGLLEQGIPLQPETRRFDASVGKTLLMRAKETSTDYRFLPEPDLLPLVIAKEEIEAIRGSLPELPDARRARLVAQYGIKESDASTLVSDLFLADFFERIAVKTAYPQIASNLLLNEILRYCDGEDFHSPISDHRLAELTDLLGDGHINNATAKKLLLRLLDTDFDVGITVREENLLQIKDRDTLEAIVTEIMERNPRAVSDYQNGRTAALRALQGQAMSRTAGRADPVMLEAIFLERLQPKKEV